MFRVLINSATLAMILVFSLVTSSSAKSNDLDSPGGENWDLEVASKPLANKIMAVDFGEDTLYAAEGNTTPPMKIYRWNGSNWETPYPSVNMSILDILPLSNENFYIGGYFTQAGSCTNCKYIAFWNGSAWESVGSELENGILTLVRDSAGTLYIGGDFTSGVAYLNGQVWQPLGGGLANAVAFDLEIDSEGNVYVGGIQLLIDPDNGDPLDTSPLLKKWNGSAWTPLDDQFSGLAIYDNYGKGIFSIATHPDHHLSVGGNFVVPQNKLAHLIGDSSAPIGSPNGTIINTLAADTCGGLYVGGDFTSVDGIYSPLLAYWDGGNWHTLETTLKKSSYFDQVNTLAFYNGYLAVGGVFTQPDLGNAKNIALWTGRDCAQIVGSGTYTFYNWREPVTIQITEAGDLAEIRVQRFNKNHPAADEIATPNLRNGVYWQIEGLTSNGQPASGFAYTLTLPSVGFTPDEKDKICHYNSLTSEWSCAASAYDPAKKTITLSGLTSFSDFTVGDNVGPTTVTLKAFRATTQTISATILVFVMLGAGLLAHLRGFK